MIKLTLLYIIAGLDLSPLPRVGTGGDGSPVRTLFNMFLAVMGAAAVLIVTISGLRMTISRGDPQTITKAKNSIIYSVAGLVIIAFAAVIVNFVFSRL